MAASFLQWRSLPDEALLQPLAPGLALRLQPAWKQQTTEDHPGMYRGGGDRPASQGAGHFYFSGSQIADAAVDLQLGADDIA